MFSAVWRDNCKLASSLCGTFSTQSKPFLHFVLDVVIFFILYRKSVINDGLTCRGNQFLRSTFHNNLVSTLQLMSVWCGFFSTHNLELYLCSMHVRKAAASGRFFVHRSWRLGTVTSLMNLVARKFFFRVIYLIRSIIPIKLRIDGGDERLHSKQLGFFGETSSIVLSCAR